MRVDTTSQAISGPKPSELFWFTSSEFFAKRIEKSFAGRIRHVPYFLEHPAIVFDHLWFSPLDKAGDRARSLLD